MATAQIKIRIKGDFPCLRRLEKLEKKLRNGLDNRSRFEKFYDTVSNFLSGGKSFLPRELKPFSYGFGRN